MNAEVNNHEYETPEQTGTEPKDLAPIDFWHIQFQGLMKEAQAKNLFAPDVLLILSRAVVEIQHQMNSILFTHEHKSSQEKE